MASGLAAGIKKSGKLDLALFYSQVPARAANLFTANKIQAASIKLSKFHLAGNKEFRAIIVNSGNANCFTGANGFSDARETAAAVAACLGVKREAVLVSSTGIIGKRLPLAKIKQATPALIGKLSRNGIDQAKAAIMTTDTFAKEVTVKFNLGGKAVTVCGVAKGAGMIAPRMATMLCFLLTDAAVTQRALDAALRAAVDNSFNCITVDGCMSTNDTVSILANAAAGNVLIDLNRGFSLFLRALNAVCLELAKMTVRDAEGATKFIQITVKHAASAAEAKNASLAIADSNLFKTAMYGSSANIVGRIVAAVGASGISVREEGLKIKFSPLKKRDVRIEVDLNRGKGLAVTYTSDLSPEYIRINAEYN